MSDSLTLGGIDFADVIQFQTKVMMGAQYGRVRNATDGQNIVIACLRIGWNDAFRHTSENIKVSDKESALDVAQKTHLKNRKTEQHAPVPEYDDFICTLLAESCFIKAFYAFVEAETSEEKVRRIQETYLTRICERLKPYKKEVYFGHIQKMFNIALKLYVCLYMCRTYLDLTDEQFDNALLAAVDHADCPIDQKILERLGVESKYTWSQFGKDDDHKVDGYIAVQKAIRDDKNPNSNLLFDFENWP